MANTVVVPTDIGNASKTSNSYTKFSQIISRPNKQTSPINTKQNFYVNGIKGFRKKMSFQGISVNAAQLINM